jgi:hypothetical protein
MMPLKASLKADLEEGDHRQAAIRGNLVEGPASLPNPGT